MAVLTGSGLRSEHAVELRTQSSTVVTSIENTCIHTAGCVGSHTVCELMHL